MAQCREGCGGHTESLPPEQGRVLMENLWSTGR